MGSRPLFTLRRAYDASSKRTSPQPPQVSPLKRVTSSQESRIPTGVTHEPDVSFTVFDSLFDSSPHPFMIENPNKRQRRTLIKFSSLSHLVSSESSRCPFTLGLLRRSRGGSFILSLKTKTKRNLYYCPTRKPPKQTATEPKTGSGVSRVCLSVPEGRVVPWSSPDQGPRPRSQYRTDTRSGVSGWTGPRTT